MTKAAETVETGTPKDARAGKRKRVEQSKASLYGDLLREVFAHLPAVDLCRAREVCREWRDAASDESLWRRLCADCWFKPVPNYPGRISRVGAGGVPFHSCELFQRGMCRLAYAEAFSERERAWITTAELCEGVYVKDLATGELIRNRDGRRWWFRFKEDAGEDWQDWDGWWAGEGHGRESIFCRDGTVASNLNDLEEDEEPMSHRWGFARDIYEIDAEMAREGWRHCCLPLSDPRRDDLKVEEFEEQGYFSKLEPTVMVGPGVYKKQRGARSPHKPKKYAKEIRAAGGNGTQFHVGCALKLWPDTDLDHWRDRESYPQCVVRRHPETWGWILESCWTLQTSWPMPTRQEEALREDLADEFLKYDATEQKLEVRMYNRGIQPEQDECVAERMVNYCQEYVKVEVCGEVEIFMPRILANRVCAKPHNRGSMRIVPEDTRSRVV